MESKEYRCCLECLCFHANYDIPEDDNREKQIREGFNRIEKDGWHFSLADYENPEFTGVKCEICHGLPTDLYKIYLIKQ